MESYNWCYNPSSNEQTITVVPWRDHAQPLTSTYPYLPHGRGRSYGDSCLNHNGTLLSTRYLNHFIQFDREKGILICESGVTLSAILDICVPYGWFLPVLPGTQWITVGGAIANDIHGKNHHLAGTFGCHINAFELLRSNNERLLCRPDYNASFFKATIGGLGLTGLITWAEIKLKPITSPIIAFDTCPFYGLDDFIALSKNAEETHEYTVAWLDCSTKKANKIRGLFYRGNHDNLQEHKTYQKRKKITLPFFLPRGLLNRAVVRGYNALLFAKGRQSKKKYRYYDKFFFPLDNIIGWNKLYGKQGFFQYQCVIPYYQRDILLEILTSIIQSGSGSFLAVLKTFSNRLSPGMLSFPMPGITLAVDFPNRPSVLDLMTRLDKLVATADGRIYPAKDSRMTSELFCHSYPLYEHFKKFIDPAISSDFWTRVYR